MTTLNGRGAGDAKAIDDELSLPILFAEKVRKAALDADSLKSDCTDVSNQVNLIADMLRSVARCAASTPSLYDRPIRRVFAEVSTTLDRALAFVRRCRRAGLLRRVVTITTGSADHRKLQSLLDASIGDLRWLLSIYTDQTVGISLPPIASTDPILSWVWSYTAAVQMAASASERADAASALATLALDNDRNKKIIIEEGGLPPLLSLLRDSPSLDARIAAATALSNLAAAPDYVSLMLKEHAVDTLVGVLSDAPMRLQTKAATIVSRMAAHDPTAQQEFARENAIRPLVALLSFQVPLEDTQPSSIHLLVEGIASPHAGGRRGGSYWERSHQRKEKEKETPEAKHQLKVACAEALWMLSRECVSNSRKITETKGLLCLSKIIEREKGELQYNCLMTVVEISSAAESDADLRCAAFKSNSPAAKSVVDQLLRLVQLGSSPALQVAAMRAIGSLSRTFPARETHVLIPLVVQLGHWNPDVAAEAARALLKFACPENFLCAEHSKAIIEFGGVPTLLRLLRSGDKTQLPSLTLLCHLALHTLNNEALERSKVLGTLESVARSTVAHHPALSELLPNAIYHLQLYRGGLNSHHQLHAH